MVLLITRKRIETDDNDDPDSEQTRNFRNEGISYKHNPEFTMLEFYCSYMDVNGMMDFCEELLRKSILKAAGTLQLEYEGNVLDFSKFERISMRDRKSVV